MLRGSTKFDVDDVGVACAEVAGDRLEGPPCGDWLPEASFFLASLLPSLSRPRDERPCYQTTTSSVRDYNYTSPQAREEGAGKGRGVVTYHFLSEALHCVSAPMEWTVSEPMPPSARESLPGGTVRFSLAGSFPRVAAQLPLSSSFRRGRWRCRWRVGRDGGGSDGHGCGW